MYLVTANLLAVDWGAEVQGVPNQPSQIWGHEAIMTSWMSSLAATLIFLFQSIDHPLLLGYFPFFLSNEPCQGTIPSYHLTSFFSLSFISFLPSNPLEGFWVTFLMLIIWPWSFLPSSAIASCFPSPVFPVLYSVAFLSSPLTPSLNELRPQRRPRYL